MKKKKKKKVIEANINPETNKKILTLDVVRKELKDQKGTFKDYFLLILGIGVSIALGALVFPLFYLFIINCLVEIVKTIRTTRNRKHLFHHVITVPCLEKKVYEPDSGPKEYQLWFRNIKGDLKVAIEVEKEEYAATKVGEIFHIVFVPKEKLPCLWFRTSEWELDKTTWPKKKEAENNAE